MYERISRLFSALMPSPSNNNNINSKMSNTNNSPSSSHDDDEMSADLLSQQSPPASGGDTAPARDAAAPPRSSLRSDACVWNSSRKQPPINTTNNNNADGRPSFQSNMGTCHSTNKRGATNDSQGAPTDNNSLQVEQNADKKMRNYGKSYARLSVRNPVNYTANAAAAAANNDDKNEEDATNNNDNDEVEGNTTKRTPPSSKKKKTHKLTRRLQHHSTKLQHNHNSSSSSQSSFTRNNNDKPTPARPTYNNQPILLASPKSIHSPVGQEIEIVEKNNEEEEEYEEFSPLTCTLSQANFFRGGMDVDGNEEEGDDGGDEEAEGSNDEEEEVVNGVGEEEGSGQLKNDEDHESKAASDPTVVKDYTAALKASTTTNNVTNQGKSNTEKRGTKRKPPTALDLALIEESTKNAAAEAANSNKNGSGRNKRRNKFKAVAAALAEKEDSQIPPYDVPTPRNAEEEGKNEEEESMGNNEVNFFPSNDDDDNEEETGTEKQSDALLSSPSAKQSEPLLSSPSVQPQGATVAAATSTVAAAAAAAAGTSEITTDELVNNLRDICDNLGKALTCPICQASLREAQLLPCCHAFCKSCLATTFNPPRSNNKGKRKKGSPPPTAYKQCPTCKNPADRRSVVPIPQLDDQVRAYKQILVVFGITPYVYGEGIAMTQLDPEDNGGMVLDEEDRRQCLQASRTVNGVVAREYETVQAKAAAAAATTRKPPSKLLTHPLRRSRSSSSKPQQQQRLTKEQMESQNELRRWQQVAKEQENVVKVNEGALNKVKGRAHQLVQRKMVQAETAKFLATVNEADESKPVAVNKTVDRTAVNEEDGSDDDEADFCTAPDSDSVEYDTAKESQGLSTTITTAAPSPMVINDGNTVKKAERSCEDRTTSTIPGSRVLDLEVSPEAQKKKEGRDSFGTVGTGNASPIVLHDGNTVRKTRLGNKDEKDKSPELHEDKTPRSSGNFLRCEGVAMKSASNADMEEDDEDESDYGAETQPLIKSAPLKSGSQEDDESEYGPETQPIIGKPAAKPAPKQAAKPDAKPAAKPAPKHADENPVAASASIDEPAQTEQIVKGSVVMVQARTWPGINKHGGVGRVTQVHSSTTSGGSAVQYDVSYVLGGKEKFVDESFVHLHKTSEEESTTRVSSARKPRKSSEKKVESRRPKRTQQKVTFKEEVSIYNEEELKHIPAEALEWAGIVPKKGKGKKKAAGKKRALADSNSNTTPTPTGTSTKKQKAAPAAAASSKIESKPKKKAKSKKEKVEAEKESNAVEALMAMAHDSSAGNLNEIINPLSNQEIVQYADERYSSLLSESGSSDVSLVLNVVTSNLSDEESDSLNSLCKLLKEKNVSLKLMKSFKANKTHLCITSASVKSKKQSKPSNVVSNARTMKVMRSTLAGLPILCPQWVNACLSKGEIVAPTGDMSIRTLPRKQADNDDECDDRFGVAKYAAAFQKGMQLNTLLSGVKVLMCGSFGGSMANDIKGLLQDAGATIISSITVASRNLSDMQSSADTDTTFVFLCDDSLLDKSCGISDALYKQAKRVCDNSEDAKVMAVHFSWLFDCISCATVMPATSYEPSAPRAKALWRLAAGVEADEAEDQGKKSQFY